MHTLNIAIKARKVIDLLSQETGQCGGSFSQVVELSLKFQKTVFHDSSLTVYSSKTAKLQNSNCSSKTWQAKDIPLNQQLQNSANFCNFPKNRQQGILRRPENTFPLSNFVLSLTLVTFDPVNGDSSRISPLWSSQYILLLIVINDSMVRICAVSTPFPPWRKPINENEI